MTGTANDASYTFYDMAGRLVRTDTTIPGITGALTTSYQLDANGNRIRLTWPDTYYVSVMASDFETGWMR
jgi:uncharacterized protein RhaS with RHS repeats